MPVDPVKDVECPKCGEQIRERASCNLHEKDVAHNGETCEEAIEKTKKAIDYALLWRCRGVKIIHGKGGRGGMSIASNVIPLMKMLSRKNDWRCVQDRDNCGAHIIWFHKR